MKALSALNYNVFTPETIAPPAPATLYTRIAEDARRQPTVPSEALNFDSTTLPDEEELSRRFDVYNWMYFRGKLRKPRIEYSNRMTSAGSYSASKRVIKIGRKYHQIFPEELDDTLKHEMIHIQHIRHDAAFKREAERIGASVRAKSHPLLQRSPRFVYVCPHCGKRYFRQKRLRMASCGVCSRGGKYDERFKLKLSESFRKRDR
jgi:predicted SprT family Zn-dependent metalloprotease